MLIEDMWNKLENDLSRAYQRGNKFPRIESGRYSSYFELCKITEVGSKSKQRL
mgnify:CR=1 FL=1